MTVDKKKALAFVLVLSVIVYGAYTFTRGNEMLPSTEDVAGSQPLADPAVAPAPVLPALTLPPTAQPPEHETPAVDAATGSSETTMDNLLAERHVNGLAVEVAESNARLEKALAEKELTRAKKELELLKAEAERQYIQANPGRWVAEQKTFTGGGVLDATGMPPLGALPAMPVRSGSSTPDLGGDGDVPNLRMIVGSRERLTAYLEYRGASYHVAPGDSVATWRVKAIMPTTVVIASGDRVSTLGFPMPASVPVETAKDAPKGKSGVLKPTGGTDSTSSVPGSGT